MKDQVFKIAVNQCFMQYYSKNRDFIFKGEKQLKVTYDVEPPTFSEDVGGYTPTVITIKVIELENRKISLRSLAEYLIDRIKETL